MQEESILPPQSIFSRESDIDLSLSDDQLVDPYSVLETPFTDRFKDTLNTLFKEELPEEGHRLRRLGALALGGFTQALDRGRAMVFVLPETFDRTITHAYEHGWNGYQMATASGLAVGGVFAVWSYAIGKTLHKSINAFPKTTKKVEDNHPVMVDVIGSAIEGFPELSTLQNEQGQESEDGYEVSPYQTRESKLGKIALAISRGFKTGLLYGSTPQIGLAKIGQHSDKSIEKRLRAVSVESALALGTLAIGVSTLMTHDFLGIAEDVRNVITNKNYLMGAAFGFIGLATVQNYFARRKKQRIDGEK